MPLQAGSGECDKKKINDPLITREIATKITTTTTTLAAVLQGAAVGSKAVEAAAAAEKT